MTKSCMMPMSATGTFFYKTVLTPLQMVIFSATFAVPFWNWLRNWNRLRNFFRKAQAPHRITLSMWRRCLLNIYLFSYAPVTQACLEMLVCKQMSESCPEDSEDPACGHYLAIDFSIECDANEYKSTYRTALGILLLIVILIPVGLLYLTKRTVAHRSVDMKLRLNDMSDWFDELDADGI